MKRINQRLRICVALFLVMLTLSACGSGENMLSDLFDGFGKTEASDDDSSLSDLFGGLSGSEDEETEEDRRTDDAWLPDMPTVADIVVPSGTAVDLPNVTVKKLGFIQYLGNYEMSEGVLALREVKNGVTYYSLLSYMGEDLLEEQYIDYKNVGDGLVIAYSPGEPVRTCKLVNVNTGEICIDEGATIIDRLTDRFYYLSFFTEPTENEDEAYGFVTSNTFISFLGPSDGDELYKGYGRIFDLETGNFVEGIVLEKPYDVYVCDDTTIIVNSEGWSTFDVYTVNGTQFASGMKNLTVCQDLIVQDTYNEGTLIYDSEMNLIRKLPAGEPVIDALLTNAEGNGETVYSNQYLKVYNSENGLYGLIDMEGNEVLATKFNTVHAIYGDCVEVSVEKLDEWLYGLYSLGGEELIPCVYEYIYADKYGLVFECDKFIIENDDYYVSGIGFVQGSGFEHTDTVIYRCLDEDDYRVKEFLIYSTGETVKYMDSDYIYGMDFLIECEEGLVEVITGQVLIPINELRQYYKVELAGEYMYCYNRDTETYTIYRVDIE